MKGRAVNRLSGTVFVLVLTLFVAGQAAATDVHIDVPDSGNPGTQFLSDPLDQPPHDDLDCEHCGHLGSHLMGAVSINSSGLVRLSLRLRPAGDNLNSHRLLPPPIPPPIR